MAVVWAVVVDAGDPSVVYSASVQGIFKSLDGGQTWTAANQGFTQVSDTNANIVAHPARPSRLFAKVGSLYRSVDGGASWTPLGSAPAGVQGMAFDPVNPDNLYVAAGAGPAVYKTIDGGDTWTTLVDAPVSGYDAALAVSPSAVFVATSQGVLVSRDGGANWTHTQVAKAASVVAIDPAHPDSVYAWADQMYASPDGGTTWSAIPLDAASGMETVVAAPTAPSTVFVGYSLPQNVFVTKFSPDGKQILYSTYLGGSASEFPAAIAVDRDGYAYVAGHTYSPDFPVTPNALQTGFHGPYTGFVAKISPDGSRLIYSTLLGGSNGDSVSAIAVDSGGNAYVTGFAGSSDFPVTPGALQAGIRQGCAALAKYPYGQGDAFVAKIRADGAGLVYSTFLGGTCGDQGFGIAVDGSGNAFVAGSTNSADFPVTQGAFQEQYVSGVNSGFLAKLNPQGSGLVYATYIGGTGPDTLSAVCIDAQGNAYVTGSSWGVDPNVLHGGCGLSYGFRGSTFSLAGGGSVLVLKLNAAGSAKIWDNYLGICSTGIGISVDPAGRTWVAGSLVPGSASGFFLNGPGPHGPPSVFPFQWSGTGFVAQISVDGATTPFASPMDTGLALALDSAGDAYLARPTSSLPDFLKVGGATAFLMRVDNAGQSGATIGQVREFRMGSDLDDPGGFGDGPMFAAGSIMVLTGAGLGPAEQVGAVLSPSGTVANSLGGTSVTFDGVAAPLLSVQAGRVVCIVPFEAAKGNGIVQVQYNGAASNLVHIPIQPLAVELLSVSATTGSAGSVVTLFLAGMGSTDPPGVDGQVNGSQPAKPVTAVDVQFANYQGSTPVIGNADLLYLGNAPGQVAGIMQINFQVPQLPPGTYSVEVLQGSWWAYDLGFSFTIFP